MLDDFSMGSFEKALKARLEQEVNDVEAIALGYSIADINSDRPSTSYESIKELMDEFVKRFPPPIAPVFDNVLYHFRPAVVRLPEIPDFISVSASQIFGMHSLRSSKAVVMTRTLDDGHIFDRTTWRGRASLLFKILYSPKYHGKCLLLIRACQVISRDREAWDKVVSGKFSYR